MNTVNCLDGTMRFRRRDYKLAVRLFLVFERKNRMGAQRDFARWKKRETGPALRIPTSRFHDFPASSPLRDCSRTRIVSIVKLFNNTGNWVETGGISLSN